MNVLIGQGELASYIVQFNSLNDKDFDRRSSASCLSHRGVLCSSRHVEMLLDLGGDGIGDIAEFGLWAE